MGPADSLRPVRADRTHPALILASESPRRRELLERIVGAVITVGPEVDETPQMGEPPCELVERLARAKAARVAMDYPEALIVAADTVVVIDGTALGKPRDAADAAVMLRRLSGRSHEVITAIALHDPNSGPRRSLISDVNSTTVRVGVLSEAMIEWYLSTGEPFDKAGGYGAQGAGAVFIEGVTGSFDNVVGLSLHALDALMRTRGYQLLDWGLTKGEGPFGDHGANHGT